MAAFPCPECKYPKSTVRDSRHTQGRNSCGQETYSFHAVRRRHFCHKCGAAWTTYEILDEVYEFALLLDKLPDEHKDLFFRLASILRDAKRKQRRAIPSHDMKVNTS